MSCVRAISEPFLCMTSINFVLKIAETGSSQVTLAGGAPF